MDKKLKAENETIIRLQNVSKTYQLDKVRVEAVKKANVEISKGEFISIVGPSGSGKSTLMHIIGLLDKPTTGTVEIDGVRTDKLSENELAKLRNRKVGFIFQSFNLLPRTTALANVVLPLQYNTEKLAAREQLAKDL